MAKRKSNIVPLPFPLKGWDTSWSRFEQPPRTSPDLLNVLPYDKNLRARGAKRPGFSVLTAGSIGTLPTLYKEARLCSTDVFAGVYVPLNEISSYPYTFKYAGICYHAESADDSTDTPAGFIPPSADRTAFDDCAACTSPPPPASDHWKKLRRCDNNAPVNLYINEDDLDDNFPAVFLRESDGVCYKVTDTFFYVGGAPGPLAGTITLKDDCTACAGDGGTGSDTYYQALRCSDDVPVDVWILASDAPSPPLFFFTPDNLIEPVYIPADAVATDTGIGTVYTIGEVEETGSCDQAGACWESSLPDTATVTFSGVALQTSCKLMNPGPGTWKATGTINTTFSLAKISEGSEYAKYQATIGLTFTVYCSETDCTGTSNVHTTFKVTLELFADSPIGYRLRIDPGTSEGETEWPKAYLSVGNIRGTCRQTFHNGNDLTATRATFCEDEMFANNAIASGGNAVWSLDF